MSKLSPAAQSVLDAFDAKQDEMNEVTWLTRNPDRDCLAAALRAAADQVVIKLEGFGQESAWYLEEIATELEAQ